MPGKDIVVVGTSTGGIDALRTLLGGLSDSFGGSVFVVMHMGADSPGVLADILNEAAVLPVRFPADGERIEPGTIYAAPPDHHLVLEPGRMRLTRGPKENRFRPAVDPLFRSAAQTYGPRVVGVILTGGLDDGTSGLWTIKQLGGTAIVQEPREALAPSMPLSALQHVEVDYRLPLAEIAPTLGRLAEMRADEAIRQVPRSVAIEVGIAKDLEAKSAGVFELGESSIYSCPECKGVLLKIGEAGRMRFRCHTGHSYTANALLSEMDEVIDESLWTTVRALEERVLLLRHLAEHLRAVDAGAFAAELRARAEATQQRANMVRRGAIGSVEPREDEAAG